MKHHDKQFKLITKFKCLWKKMFCFCTPKTPQQHPPLKYRWGDGVPIKNWKVRYACYLQYKITVTIYITEKLIILYIYVNI